MCIAHYQFAVIHPFRNGDWRVGRIMNLHMITWSHQLELSILYLSRYILEHKQNDYEYLADVSRPATT